MRLKLYRAASMADAMAQLRDELGPEALILSTKRVPGGIELTAALDQPDEPPACPSPACPPPACPQPATPASPTTAPAAFPASAFATPGYAGPALPGPATRAGELDPQYHAIHPALARRLAGPDLARRLQDTVRFAPLRFDGGIPLLLAGTPGAGKTLTVARLATRLVLAGARPLVITADGRRAGGAEELAAYTRLLGLTLLVASTPATLARALAEATQGAPILIDTSGINPFEPAETAALAELIAAAGACPILVMQAGAHCEEAAEQAAMFAEIGIAHLLPTRLDIARRLGSVLAVADPAGPGLALTEAGIGTGPTDGLVALTPALLAERLLRAQPPPARLRSPIFPSARAHAEAWNHQSHG